MLILGIESSCDETGIAIYDTKLGLLANTVHSQIVIHRNYGGVVPELASRNHIEWVLPLIEIALKKANIEREKLDVIAYTAGPGLAGALLVGASVANGLALALNRPIIPIHHLEGHLLSPMLTNQILDFPCIVLLISGAHTQLIYVKQIGNYKILGETIDDAVGEAFDKSAKLLGLEYPGGVAISNLATLGKPGIVNLPRPLYFSKNLNFSFSGLKTAVLNQVNYAKRNNFLNEKYCAHIAYAFVDSVVNILVHKSLSALHTNKLKCLVVTGGVSANKQLRENLNRLSMQHKFKIFYPALEFCTDNGAMIALAAAIRIKNWPEQASYNYSYTIKPRWDLTSTLY